MLWLLAAALGAWALLAAVVAANQRRFVFPAPAVARLPSDSAALLRLPSPSGEGVALSLPGPPGAPAVVFFHGNGEQLADREDLARALARRGLGVLLVEYPGYGLAAAAGPPSEAGCYAAAESALAHLRDALGVPPERTLLVGHSLGSGVAAEMALRGHGARVALLSPFTSVADVGRRVFPFLPVSLLVRHRFETIAKAPRIALPALVVHGDRDQVIPVDMGRRVAAALPHASLHVMAGAEHDLLSGREERWADCLAAFARGDECLPPR